VVTRLNAQVVGNVGLYYVCYRPVARRLERDADRAQRAGDRRRYLQPRRNPDGYAVDQGAHPS